MIARLAAAAAAVLVILAAGAVLPLPHDGSSTFAASARPPGGEDLVTPRIRAAVDSGLSYLAKIQREDGSFGQSGRAASTACAALAGLAFMSDGSQPGRGPYGENVERALAYVLGSRQPSGLLEYGLPHHAMYSHAFSTLFLAEAWGTGGGGEDVKGALKSAVELIVRTQSRRGGWRYQPKVADADISVTVCQIVALRAAANAGIAVPRETVDRALGYLLECSLPGGGFAYQAGGSEPALARTGGALASLLLAGREDAPQVGGAVEFLEANRETDERFFYYGHYYAAQGMHLLGGEAWPAWYRWIAAELLRRRDENGSWYGRAEERVQSTAMAVMVLTIPNGYLPIYQR